MNMAERETGMILKSVLVQFQIHQQQLRKNIHWERVMCKVYILRYFEVHVFLRVMTSSII